MPRTTVLASAPSILVRLALLSSGALITTGLTGCVGQGSYDNLYENNRSLTEDNTRLNRELEESRRSLSLLQGSNVSGEGNLTALQRQNAEYRSQLDKALADLRDLNGRIGSMQFGPLDAETNQALTALAAEYPDLIKFDEASGMLRFASDLTFDSGSSAVKDDAKRALAALGRILNSSAAQQYDVWIEGHTDLQRISANTARQHATNRHLSAHRAISVIDELAHQGVNPGKMMAGGWGEFRPIAANTSSGNTPANRRVEIYLAKARTTTLPTPMPMAPATKPMTTTTKPDMSKTPTRQIDTTK